MVITKAVHDELTEKAKVNPRLRCNLNMRNNAVDKSYRMLNALDPVQFEEYFYDENGNITDTI